MYERFTDRARKAMQLANQEAMRFNHVYIGTEHILLGLIKEGQGVAANVLKKLNIDLRKIRLEVEKIVPSGPDVATMGKLPQTPRAMKVIEYSVEEARNLNHNYVGTEHLLLGLLREHVGVAPQVLMNLGLRLEDVRKEILDFIGHMPPKPTHVLDRALAPAKLPGELEKRIAALESQLVTTRFLLGGILGTSVGALLGDRLGAVIGLLAGGTIALLGRKIPALLAGAVAGGFIGSVHFADEGGVVAGMVVGALLAGCVAEIGRPAQIAKTGG